MAAVTGTASSYSVGSGGGIREDLEDVIWDLFPMDTWLLSNLDKVTAENTLHEWLGDNLAAAAANRQIEGDDATFGTIVNAARFNNYQQISRKTFLISGTLEKVKKAGRRSEVARQAMKQMRELKRDMELALIGNQAGTTGGTGTGRSTASMESWIGATAASATTATRVVLATVNASATTAPVASGVPGTSPTDGTTTGALTEANLNFALEGAWQTGGDPTTILVAPFNKKQIDTITGVATRFVDVNRGDEASIVGAANLYVSSFGNHRVIMHRYARDEAALCLDVDMWAVSFLRRPFTEKLAKTGDGTKHQMLVEFGLVARNNLASSKVVALA